MANVPGNSQWIIGALPLDCLNLSKFSFQMASYVKFLNRLNFTVLNNALFVHLKCYLVRFGSKFYDY